MYKVSGEDPNVGGVTSSGKVVNYMKNDIKKITKEDLLNGTVPYIIEGTWADFDKKFKKMVKEVADKVLGEDK